MHDSQMACCEGGHHSNLCIWKDRNFPSPCSPVRICVVQVKVAIMALMIPGLGATDLDRTVFHEYSQDMKLLFGDQRHPTSTVLLDF
jgi:hypothetical protein